MKLRRSSRRVSNHRRKLGFGGKFTIDDSTARKFTHTASLLHKLDFEPQEAPRLDDAAAFDRLLGMLRYVSGDYKETRTSKR